MTGFEPVTSFLTMREHCFTLEPDGILLVTDFIEQEGLNILEVQFLAPDSELILTGAYIDAAALTTHFALSFLGDRK